MRSFKASVGRCIIFAASILLSAETTLALPFSDLAGTSHSVDKSSRGLAKRDWPIKKGYVAFGDSYGAGMGTGTTSGDSCRVGSNNFADLLNKWTNNPSIDYQRMVCSGDTTVGLNRQIDEWKNPSNADIATVSIGGNDLGFSDLVWYCVITPNTATTGARNRQKCLETEAAARQLLDDTSANGLQAKLTAAYKKILDKSGRSDFHVYVTSYVDFFNQDDPDCDKSTFHYEWARYNPPSDWPLNRIVLLTTSLRAELNDLVRRLNTAISNAVDEANRQHGSVRVHFVDLQPPWANNQHHWCETGNFHEPDASRQDTWFFLSGWSDVPIEGQASVDIAQDATDLLALMGGIKLPDPNNCDSQLGTDPDPHALWMCRASQSIAIDPTGALAQSLPGANVQLAALEVELAALGAAGAAAQSEILLAAAAAAAEVGITSDPGNVTANHISYWLPTRQIKTFHPRSPGMVAYRDAVIAAVGQAQGATGTCTLDITEIWTCEASPSDLYAEFSISDGSGKTLYSTPQSADGPGEPINNDDPFSIQANGLAQQLTVTAEHTNDYIQFNYGGTSWTSGTTTGSATCQLQGADWNKNGPQNCPSAALTREFKCHFPC